MAVSKSCRVGVKRQARALIATRHEGLISHANPGADPEGRLKVQTSVHLKGLLWTAPEISPAPMAPGGVAGAGFPTARLFWNPAPALHVPPLPDRDAAQLFEAAADYFKLRHLDFDVP